MFIDSGCPIPFRRTGWGTNGTAVVLRPGTGLCGVRRACGRAISVQRKHPRTSAQTPRTAAVPFGWGTEGLRSNAAIRAARRMTNALWGPWSHRSPRPLSCSTSDRSTTNLPFRQLGRGRAQQHRTTSKIRQSPTPRCAYGMGHPKSSDSPWRARRLVTPCHNVGHTSVAGTRFDHVEQVLVIHYDLQHEQGAHASYTRCMELCQPAWAHTRRLRRKLPLISIGLHA